MTKEELHKAKHKFNFQRWNARKRVDRLGHPIEWHLTFDEWLQFWLNSGHWNERGCGAGKYVMARKQDLGHYELGNIEIKLASENTIEGNILNPGRRKGHITTLETKQKISAKLKGHAKTQEHKDKLSKAFAKPVMTPYGRFDSKKQAEQQLHKDFGWQRRKDPDNWYYID